MTGPADPSAHPPLLSRLVISCKRNMYVLFGRLPERARIAVIHLFSPSYSVGTLPLVRRADGALLLVRHTYRSNWGVPGGLLNRGEQPIDGAVREVGEEVGLAIEVVGDHIAVVDPRDRRVDLVFDAKPAVGADVGAVCPTSPEIADVRWFLPGELPVLQREVVAALAASDRRRLA